MIADSTLIGQVPATISSLSDEPDTEATRGPIDVAVVAGRVEISLGTLWATLTEDETLDLALLVLTAEATARFVRLRQMLDHARAELEAIEMGAP